MLWEKVDITWGNTSKPLPFSIVQGGSLTTHTHDPGELRRGHGLKQKLQEIAATDLGGSPDDYEVAGERVYRRGNRGRGLSFAQAAERAIALGGAFDGHELPEDINPVTAAAATAQAGLGVMGVARDSYGMKDPRNRIQSFVAAFAEVEVDLETGRYRLIDYLGVGDVGTVVNPRRLEAQIHGGAVQGFGQVQGQKLGVRPAVRGVAGDAVLQHEAAEHSRRPARDGLGRGQPSGRELAGRGERGRRGGDVCWGGRAALWPSGGGRG